MPRERLAGPADRIATLEANVARVLRGKPGAIRHAVIALFARGHLLIEDVPGVGKTTLARALARSIGGTFHRIQFTSDLLPSDVLGVSVLDPKTRRVRVQAGAGVREPRAGRRNQPDAAAHAERAARGDERRPGVGRRAHVPAGGSVPGDGDPELRGALRHLSARPSRRWTASSCACASTTRRRRTSGASCSSRRGAPRRTLARLGAVLSVAEVRRLQDAAERVAFTPELADYIVAVARETRRSPHLSLGVSPRGELAWRNAARAAALSEGRDYVLPDDLKMMAVPVLAHRVIPASPVEAVARSRQDVERVLADILDRLPAPG